MGVINVTPDSFSDGGRWLDADHAIARAHELIAQGADIIDIGGESTRPGAVRIDTDEELRRVLPVVQALASEPVQISVDTMRAAVAEIALEAGADIVNDVSGGRADPAMVPLLASAGAPVVLMHWRGHSDVMQDLTRYDDVVADVLRELTESVEAALAAGVAAERIIVDPGLGFSKTGDQNWTLLANLHRFVELGFPLLVAASRKRFLGELLADGDRLRDPAERDDASAALTTLAAHAGAWAVRVHEVKPSADAVRVVQRLGEGSVDV